jgi:hypothetical protein
MSPKLALKASQLPVVPFSDGASFRVGGDSGVYDVYPDMISGRMRCSCPAGKGCSHILAAQFHTEKMQKLQRKNA